MMHSTMGAPLSAEESATIHMAWIKLIRAGHALTLTEGAPCGRGEDQVQMLEQATNLVQLIYELRQAISQAWHYANKRAFPEPSLRRPKRVSNAASLAVLNLTQRDLDEVLATLDLTKGVTNGND